MFGEIKMYIYAVFAMIVGGFLAVFKYRGMKVDSLEEDVAQKEADLKAVEEYHKAKDKVQEFEKDNAVAATATTVKGDRFGNPYVNDGKYSI